MLKHTLAASAAVAAVLALSAPSYADDPNSATVTINGTVTATCDLGGVSSVSPIDFSTITLDGDGKVASGNTKSVTLGEVWCNGTNNTYTVTANPLTTSATAPSGFVNRIDYTLTTPLVSDSLDSATNTPATGTEGAFFLPAGGQGSVTLDVGTAPVIAGSYTGTVVINVTPG